MSAGETGDEKFFVGGGWGEMEWERQKGKRWRREREREKVEPGGRPKIKSASEVAPNSKKGGEKVKTQHKPRNQRTAMAFDTRMAMVTVTELRRAYRSDRSFRYILVFDFY